ncbi:hypothetical protein A5784_20650 [Mycobacterium sp. 852013-50091_SCH5140682]|uniref:hypothetical protein n=1 Tax=Mycobacterium sp. 852013-50091_SCH5140682 TaxID=1834109 RepID=UPI0007EA98EF|nr:hypothetical protein [Mycobacterium sp. 852013-50091_SCH5140682]OBC00433.1 hypothetical protein A5784_20650 [Mycobacterium sp. 852013-50091_SCH5140682]
MTGSSPWWIAIAPEELAATILPLFSYPHMSPHVHEGFAIFNIAGWCRTGLWAEPKFIYRQGNPYTDPDLRPIAEAIQVLEQSRLLMRFVAGDSTTISVPVLGLTRRGMYALESNTVRPHLGLRELGTENSNTPG